MSIFREIPTQYRDYLASRGEQTLGQADTKLRMRGFWVGGFLSFFLAVGAPYANMVIRGTYMSADFTTPGAIFLFLLLIGVFNCTWKLTGRYPQVARGFAAVLTAVWLWAYWPLDDLDVHRPGFIFSTPFALCALFNAVLAVRGQSLALNRAELILVYAMLLIVSALCTMGMAEQLPGMISAVFYYATPENQWAEKLIPHLPSHVMADDGAGNKLFFEGAASAVPYGAWVEPLLWWAVFLLALYIAMISIAVILRRQWMERERLAYPAAQVGLAMIRGEDPDRLVNGFFKRPAMWIGWAIPVIVGATRGAKAFGATVPVISTNWGTVQLADVVSLRLNLDFITLGFSYLIHTHVAIGIVFFHILARFQMAALDFAGIKSSQSTYIGVTEAPLLAYQGVGALLAMVLVGLWLARDHLKDVLLKAVGRAPQVDDGDEILSYQSAVCGAMGGIAVMAGWLWIMGTPLWVSVLFILLSLLVFIGMTRIVVEAGLVKLRTPMAASDLVVQGLGSSLVGPAAVGNLALTYIWAADIQVFVMGTCAHALKMIEEMDRRGRRLVFAGIVIALFIGSLGSLWMIFHLCFEYGGINMNTYFFRDGPSYAYQFAMRNLDPAGFYWPGAAFFTTGGVAMALMMFARMRLPWWPLHPVGFPIGANYITEFMWFSIFFAWAVKVCVLRYAGSAVYQSSQSFFLGLIAGQVTSAGAWLVIDYFFGTLGNSIY